MTKCRSETRAALHNSADVVFRLRFARKSPRHARYESGHFSTRAEISATSHAPEGSAERLRPGAPSSIAVVEAFVIAGVMVATVKIEHADVL
jgi:hypothetical protein